MATEYDSDHSERLPILKENVRLETVEGGEGLTGESINPAFADQYRVYSLVLLHEILSGILKSPISLACRYPGTIDSDGRQR